MKKKKTLDQEHSSKEVQRFLGELAIIQEKLKKNNNDSKNLEKLAEQALEDNEENDENLYDAELYIPPDMEPYLDKEISFDLFISLLMDKVDEQRIHVDQT